MALNQVLFLTWPKLCCVHIGSNNGNQFCTLTWLSAYLNNMSSILQQTDQVVYLQDLYRKTPEGKTQPKYTGMLESRELAFFICNTNSSKQLFCGWLVSNKVVLKRYKVYKHSLLQHFCSYLHHNHANVLFMAKSEVLHSLDRYISNCYMQMGLYVSASLFLC